MALVLGTEHPGDGTVIVRVDVAVDVIATVVMPTAAYLTLGPELVADHVARRYAARKARLRTETR